MSEEKQKRPGAKEIGAEERVEDRHDNTRQADTEIPAIRHVGPTLESDSEYFPAANPGYSTPEAQIAAEAGHIDAEQRQIQEDDFDPLAGRTLEDHPERLKTRLPGDSSSEPHTDVGPNNATSLQQHEDVRHVDKPNRA